MSLLYIFTKYTRFCNKNGMKMVKVAQNELFIAKLMNIPVIQQKHIQFNQ